MDGARASFFRASRRFECFVANFRGNIAWTTLARTRRIFLRAGLGRSVKHSTLGGRDMMAGDGFGLWDLLALRSFFRWKSSPDRYSRAAWG